MAITTMVELQSAVANWTGRSNLSARIPEFIALCESDFNRELDIRTGVETTHTVTASANFDVTNLAQTLLGIRSIHIDGDPDTGLEYLTPDYFHTRWLSNETGRPRAYTIEGDQVVWGPQPDADYVFKILYSGHVPALTTASANAVLTNAPDVYLYGSLKHAYRYLREYPEADATAVIYDKAVKDWKRQQRKSKYTSGSLKPRVRGSTP